MLIFIIAGAGLALFDFVSGRTGNVSMQLQTSSPEVKGPDPSCGSLLGILICDGPA
jgi:hypothetical protein